MLGAAGRMGCSIIACSQNFTTENNQNQAISLCAALEDRNNANIGEDVGHIAGLSTKLGITLQASNDETLQDILEQTKTQVVIDFSSPASTLTALNICRNINIPCVIGTTGFNQKQRDQIVSASSDIAILLASNMSLGANLLFHLTSRCADLLGSGFDVEIIETHHHYKKDAPSGTALSLRDAIKTSETYKNYHEIYGRQGTPGKRPINEVGIHTIRGGDVVGDHTVLFLGNGERLELTHKASSRHCFATGALRAALFLAEGPKKPKMYNMKDVLGLN